jgi:hypothetical protein
VWESIVAYTLKMSTPFSVSQEPEAQDDFQPIRPHFNTDFTPGRRSGHAGVARIFE